MEDKEDTVSSGYAKLREDVQQRKPPSSWTFQRQISVICVALVALASCGLLGGVIALRIQLHMTSAGLLQNEGQLIAYETIIKNLTAVFANDKISADGGTPSPAPNNPSVSYFRWGSSTCPNTAQLIYKGVTASGSGNLSGGGSNHICMTLQPDFLSPMAGKQGGRSYIYGSEYRNGGDYHPMANLHGHDAPCVACLVTGRSNVLMIPGTTMCPDTANWTREYYGILMAGRKDLKRTSYICVDVNAESTPGSSYTHQASDLIFPVEAFCNTGGGLPCAPYVDGYEVTCAVCTL